MYKLLSLLLAIASCGGGNVDNGKESPAKSSLNWDEVTRIEYRYGDSSLPPEYHRSYTIAITDSEKSIVIDSYGKVVLTKKYPNTPAEFQAFRAELSQKGIKKHKEKKSDPCDGGTSETIRMYNADEMFFNAYVYHCSGESGTLVIPYGTSAFIHSQLPENVDSLIESTIRNDVEDEVVPEP